MDLSDYKRIESAKIKTYQYKSEPFLIHVLKTGFTHIFIVIYEDVNGQFLGETELLNSAEIKEKFNIDIENDEEVINKFKIKKI